MMLQNIGSVSNATKELLLSIDYCVINSELNVHNYCYFDILNFDING